MSPGAFAHLCRECLDVPSAQCGYRGCPQKVTHTASVLDVAPQQPQGNSLATVYVDPKAVARPAVTDAALATRAVDPGKLPAGPLPATKGASPTPVPLHGVALPPPQSDALATRYVSPTTEAKR